MRPFSLRAQRINLYNNPVQTNIYTDGSSLGNPGPGGFCAILKTGSKEIIVKGGDKYTTNNRMEMSAIIAGLYYLNKKFPEIKTCGVFSDSSLIIDTMNKGWKRKKNLDLWAKMDTIAKKFDGIKWTWIRGHAGHKENTKADLFAVMEAKKQQGLVEQNKILKI